MVFITITTSTAGRKKTNKKKKPEKEKTLFSLVQECVGQREPLCDIADLKVLECQPRSCSWARDAAICHAFKNAAR